jgi:replicative DNA helicase
MKRNAKLDKIAGLVLKITVEKNMPTVVFFSETEETDLIKKLFSLKTKKEYNEQNFAPEDWTDLADMVLELSKIPLILKTIDSVENAMYLIDDFCSEMKNSNGLIIIDGGEDDFSKIQHRQNIIVKIV